uniref:Jacalin-type lectin domain-containing protein n=1 Tax=Leersia perrieri TaxID=77586 RepID=A0A0D9V4Q9_9ORYZ
MLQPAQAHHHHQTQRRLVASSKAIKVGPWGGVAGTPWDDGAHRGVRSITFTYARFLESMTVEYDRFHGEKHGGGGGDGRNGGSRTEVVKVDYPYEFVTGVSGRCGPVVHGGSPVVRSLTLRTSRGTVHGPFGEAGPGGGVPFDYPMEGGVVVGFSGRSGWWHLDAVGLHVAALRPETLCDTVQERGAAAYRSFVYGDSGTHGSMTLQKRKAFEWCYK